MSRPIVHCETDGLSSLEFGYLIEKIKRSEFATEPFPHIEIRDFLSREHFALVASDPQICLRKQESTEDLVTSLDDLGYEVIAFPGCVASVGEYLDWFNSGSGRRIHGATESFGIAYRLLHIRSEILRRLNAFLLSDEFKSALTEKFGISSVVEIDGGIHKYLHGYEISPHPDIRRKALTWMVNINPDRSSEDIDFHTHYMKFKNEWAFISNFWRGNRDVERDWLPWGWCESVKQQTRNNSIVIFAPSDDSLHAIKASYDHLATQRTQLYGNLWYEPRDLLKLDYRQFDLLGSTRHKDWRETGLEKIRSTKLGRTLLAVRNAVRGNRGRPLSPPFR